MSGNDLLKLLCIRLENAPSPVIRKEYQQIILHLIEVYKMEDEFAECVVDNIRRNDFEYISFSDDDISFYSSDDDEDDEEYESSDGSIDYSTYVRPKNRIVDPNPIVLDVDNDEEETEKN